MKALLLAVAALRRRVILPTPLNIAVWIIAAVLVGAMSGCAAPATPARCEAEGGCIWVSRTQLTALLQKVADNIGMAAYLQGHIDGAEICRKPQL